MTELESSVKKLPQGDQAKYVILGGDFNVGGVDWENERVKPGASYGQCCEELLRVATENSLTQMNDKPTRNNSVLDLCFTSHPTLVKNTHVTPGLSDHDIVSGGSSACTKR